MRMTRCLLALTLLLTALPAWAEAQIGMNLVGVSYYSPGQPFLNRFKARGPWDATKETEPLKVARDWSLLNFPTGATGVSTAVKMDSPGATFVLKWTGDATWRFVAPISNVVTGDHRVTFTWDAAKATAPDARTILTVKSGVPHNIVLVRADQEALYDSGERFNPDIMNLLKGVSHIRFMDWMRVNSAGQDVTTVTIEDGPDSSYMSGQVPLSVIVAFANELNARPWITLPPYETDADVAKVFTYLDSASKQKPIIEYANEVWNMGFAIAKYAYAGQTEFPKDGTSWYAKQVARIAKISRGHRAGVVAMWQFGSATRSGKKLADALVANGVEKDIEAIGGADYLSGGLNKTTSSALTLKVANDVAGTLASFAPQIATHAQAHKDFAALAASHGWKYYTYEGGNYSLMAAGYPAADQAAMQAFFRTVQESPAAAANIEANFVNFDAAGGALYTPFNLSGPSTKYGYFGLINTPATWAMYRARIDKQMLSANDNQLLELRARVQALADEIDRVLPAYVKARQ